MGLEIFIITYQIRELSSSKSKVSHIFVFDFNQCIILFRQRITLVSELIDACGLYVVQAYMKYIQAEVYAVVSK